MKRNVVALALGLLLAAAPASAQVYGQWKGAETIPNGGHEFGGYLLTSDNVLGLLAQLRLSFYPNVDFGFQGGFSRLDYSDNNQTLLQVGTGLKVKLSDGSERLPVVTAIAADLGIETGDNFNILVIEPSFIASRKLGSGQGITPYGRLGIAITRINIDDQDRTDTSFPLHLGAEFGISAQLKIVTELQIRMDDDLNDTTTLSVGVNLPF